MCRWVAESSRNIITKVPTRPDLDNIMKSTKCGFILPYDMIKSVGHRQRNYRKDNGFSFHHYRHTFEKMKKIEMSRLKKMSTIVHRILIIFH